MADRTPETPSVPGPVPLEYRRPRPNAPAAVALVSAAFFAAGLCTAVVGACVNVLMLGHVLPRYGGVEENLVWALAGAVTTTALGTFSFLLGYALRMTYSKTPPDPRHWRAAATAGAACALCATIAYSAAFQRGGWREVALNLISLGSVSALPLAAGVWRPRARRDAGP